MTKWERNGDREKNYIVLILEDKRGNGFKKMQSREAEEHGGNTASRAWVKYPLL